MLRGLGGLVLLQLGEIALEAGVAGRWIRPGRAGMELAASLAARSHTLARRETGHRQAGTRSDSMVVSVWRPQNVC